MSILYFNYLSFCSEVAIYCLCKKSLLIRKIAQFFDDSTAMIHVTQPPIGDSMQPHILESQVKKVKLLILFFLKTVNRPM